MAGTTFKIKQSAVLGKIPAAADLTQGELALNTIDQKLYSKDGANVVFEIGAPKTEITEHEFIATSSQTIFPITGGYVSNDNIEVYLNGIKLLASADFTRTDGVNVVLTTGASALDEVVIKAFTLVVVSNTVHSTPDSAIMPSGTTAERDALPVAGYTRWNEDNDILETYNGTIWVDQSGNASTYTVGDGGLTEINFTSADNTKLDGIDTGANLYVHPTNHAISVITGLQTALDAKVDDSQVLTDVPSGALFTDTTVTVNDTLISISTTEALSANQGKVLKGLADGLETRVALNDAKVSNVAHPLVETAVPVGAVFTDTETTTTLSIATNILSYVDELGATTNLDLSLYLDDTNLAYIASGALNGSTGIATFTRSDATTFTVDLSALLDDTSVTVNNTLTSTSTTEALSANQGKVLKGLADGLETRVALNDAKVSNVAHPLVETAVPVGALFTDTIYTHPAAHSISEVTGLQAELDNIRAEAVAMAIALG